MYKLLLEQLKEAQNQPHKLSELHLLMSYEFSKLSEELGEMIEPSTILLRDLMIENKTVSKARALYDVSDLGIKEKKIRIQLKSLEKMMSAVKRRLETLGTEAFNQY